MLLLTVSVNFISDDMSKVKSLLHNKREPNTTCTNGTFKSGLTIQFCEFLDNLIFWCVTPCDWPIKVQDLNRYYQYV